MRITFILPFAGLSGGIRVVATYARLLQERGHQVYVISLPARPPSGWRFRLRRLLGRVPSYQPSAQTPLLDVLGERHRVTPGATVTARDVPDGDAIIATWWETAEWVAAMPPSKGRKFYLLQGFETFGSQPYDRVVATYGLDLQKIAVSNFIRNVILKTGKVRGEIAIIPNAVDLEQFRNPLRQKNRILTVGFLYSNAPLKNIALALQALEQVRREHPDLRVVAFGAGPATSDLPLPDWIDYHKNPDQAEIPRLYAACDLWLFPSREEGFGLPILEAMACRTPVLATNAGAAPDLIDGRNGRILPHDPEAFATAILEFARMPPEEWNSWSDAAFETASHNRWEDAADRLLAVIEN